LNVIHDKLVGGKYGAVIPAQPFQHLYILSYEDIQVGDFYIDDCNLIRQAITSDKDYWASRPDYKKIIATTNEELRLICKCGHTKKVSTGLCMNCSKFGNTSIAKL